MLYYINSFKKPQRRAKKNKTSQKLNNYLMILLKFTDTFLQNRKNTTYLETILEVN